MRTIRAFYSFAALFAILFFSSCEKESNKLHRDRIIGEWEAYESVVNKETSKHFALFNTFATAIEFTESGYLLFIAGDKGNPNPESYSDWEIQGEILMLFERDEELRVTTKVEKLTDSELWLRYEENSKEKLVKFRKL